MHKSYYSFKIIKVFPIRGGQGDPPLKTKNVQIPPPLEPRSLPSKKGQHYFIFMQFSSISENSFVFMQYCIVLYCKAGYRSTGFLIFQPLSRLNGIAKPRRVGDQRELVPWVPIKSWYFKKS